MSFDPLTVMWFLVSITVLVAVHEFGHFYVARLCGVKVLRFSIGFGPRIARWVDKKGTEFAFSAIPFGGYVKMLGERDEGVSPEDLPYSHDRKPVTSRIAIAVAGPVANFILAVFLYWAIFLNGTVALAPVLGEIKEGSIAALADLESGQEIVSVDGVETESQRDVLLALMNRLGETGVIHLEVKYPDSDFIYESEARIDKWLQGVEAPNPIDGLGLSFYVPPISLEIVDVMPESAAAKAGLKKGDRVYSANGEVLKNGQAWIDFVKVRPGELIAVEVERDGSRLGLQLTPAKKTLDSGEEVGFAGVSMPRERWPETMMRTQHFNVFEAFIEAGDKTWETAGFALLSIRKLVFGEISVKNLSGPIGIAKVAGDSGKEGLSSFIQFLAYMSVLLGVLNLLPIPMLDGGHILFYIIEWVKGSPVPEKIQLLSYQAGLAVLLSVMVVASYYDILRL